MTRMTSAPFSTKRAASECRMTSDADKVNLAWGKPRPEIAHRNHWLTHPLTRAHLQLRATGDHRKNAFHRWREHFIPDRLERVISIGGGFERVLVQQGYA